MTTPPAPPGTIEPSSLIRPGTVEAPVLTQARISAEITAARDDYARSIAAGAPVRSHPDRDYAPYRSSTLRHPRHELTAMGSDPEDVELSGPVFGVTDITDLDHDLTRRHQGEPLASGSPSPAASSTGPAVPCVASSSRYGRPTRPAATRTCATSTPHRSTRTSPAWDVA